MPFVPHPESLTGFAETVAASLRRGAFPWADPRTRLERKNDGRTIEIAILSVMPATLTLDAAEQGFSAWLRIPGERVRVAFIPGLGIPGFTAADILGTASFIAGQVVETGFPWMNKPDWASKPVFPVANLSGTGPFLLSPGAGPIFTDPASGIIFNDDFTSFLVDGETLPSGKPVPPFWRHLGVPLQQVAFTGEVASRLSFHSRKSVREMLAKTVSGMAG